MASLPTPGSDNGTWGTKLNEFLQVAHSATGEVKGAISVTGLTTALTAKASLVSGTVPINQLPPLYFDDLSGTGAVGNPYYLNSVVFKNYLKSLPGWIEGNVLRGDLVWVVPPVGSGKNPSADPSTFSWLELNALNAYQLNSFDNDVAYLFDNVNAINPNPNWGQALPTNEIIYEFRGNATINKIVLWDGQGTNTSNPVIIQGIKANYERVTLITFTGENYNVSTTYDFPSNPVFRWLRIVHTTGQISLGELRIFGVESGRTINSFTKRKRYLTDHLGTNAFEWEFVAPQAPDFIEPIRAEAIKSFSGIRHYLDWHTFEYVQGQYTFSPAHRGGWDLDVIYQWMNDNNIYYIANVKESPDWLYNQYVDGSQTGNLNTPIEPGLDRTIPANYHLFAKALFQLAARYGSTIVPLNQVEIFTGLRWNNDTPNVKKTGLNIMKYIEVENERDKWWAGRNAYQTAYEYAAMLSACYDGHMGTMGPGYGIKTADPNMKVAMCGVANPRPDYLRGIIDWCKQYRGYLPDGTVNLCMDIANIHDYSNDASSSQSGNPTRGAAPEKSRTGVNATDWSWVIQQFVGKDIEVWNTECGYDINQGSILKAIAIGNRTIEQTQSDWLVRTCLLNLEKGVNRTLAYMLNDVDINNPTRFSSCGMKGRQVQTDYAYLKTATAGYWFLEKANQDPAVLILKNDAGKHLYICWIPDEIGRTAQYTLTRKDGSTVSLALTETPIIIK